MIEVQAGQYTSDVATWTQDDLTLRAVGGRVRLLAQGHSEQGKGIFVCQGRRMVIEGFDFVGARVPDRNGAGVRLERGSLTLRDCRFEDNENGLLSANDASIELDIENCDFGPIVAGTGRTHNCYVGAIGRLSVTGSYFHQGASGHLMKTRAAVNHIFYNRFSDEIGGRASFELEFPNGGLALVVGNLIQQSATTENPHLIAYGNEGLNGPRHELQLIHNTLVDRRPSRGIYLRTAPGTQQVRLVNNLLAGNPKFQPDAGWEAYNNFMVDWDSFMLAIREDYRLSPQSALRGRAVDSGASSTGVKLRPTRQYRHPCGTEALAAGLALSPGAFQG